MCPRLIFVAVKYYIGILSVRLPKDWRWSRILFATLHSTAQGSVVMVAVFFRTCDLSIVSRSRCLSVSDVAADCFWFSGHCRTAVAATLPPRLYDAFRIIPPASVAPVLCLWSLSGSARLSDPHFAFIANRLWPADFKRSGRLLLTAVAENPRDAPHNLEIHKMVYA